MTALTRPARPDEDDARLRPVPWRRMAGVTWRQHRIALAGVAALLGALAVWLWIIGTPLHHAYAAATACHPASSAACQNLISTFNVSATSNFMGNKGPGGVLLQLVPVLIGAFVGAPVLARELETGTFRFAWTQGFGRWRWALAKLVLLAVVLAAATGAVGVLVSWYYQPEFGTGNQAPGYETSPLVTLFSLREVTFPAWTLAAFTFGALAGMLIRRVVPAIVATLAVYAGLAFAAGGFLREHYLTPLVTTSNNFNLPGTGTAWIISQWSTKDGRFAFAGGLPPHDPRQPVLLFPSSGEGRGSGGCIRAVPLSARLHAVDQLPAGQPVLALPVDRGRLAARAVSAAHRRNHLAGPPPRRLTHPLTGRRVTPRLSLRTDGPGNHGAHLLVVQHAPGLPDGRPANTRMRRRDAHEQDLAETTARRTAARPPAASAVAGRRVPGSLPGRRVPDRKSVV